MPPSPLPNLPPARMRVVLGVLVLLSLGEFSRELSPPAAPTPFCPHPWGLVWLGVGVGRGSAALPEPLRELCSALRVPWVLPTWRNLGDGVLAGAQGFLPPLGGVLPGIWVPLWLCAAVEGQRGAKTLSR